MLVWATQGVEVYKDFDRAADRQQAHVCWYSVQDDAKTILGDTVALILNQFESRELGQVAKWMWALFGKRSSSTLQMVLRLEISRRSL
jgi:hypothetical protein